MAAAFVQAIGSATPAAGSSGVITTSATATVGQRIILCGACFSDDTITGITDNAGTPNTYTVDIEQVTANVKVWIASAQVTSQLTSGGTITVSYSGDESWQCLSAFTLSGIATSSYTDGTGTYTGGAAAWDTSDTATTSADAVIVGAIGLRDPDDQTHTAGTNLTEVHELYNPNMNFASEYRVLSATGTFDVSGTWSFADNQLVGVHVVYKAAPSGLTPPYVSISVA